MCRQLCYLISLILVLILVDGANAAEPGLVGWWRLDEGAGSTVADSSGAEHNGFFVDGNPEWVEGMYAIALKFDGVNKVEIPDHADFHLEDAVSVALWVNPESGQSEDAKFFIKQKSGKYPYCLQYDGNSQEIYANINTSAQFNTRPRIPNFPGQWAHLCFTYNGNALILYKDGEEVARVDASGKLQQNDLSLTIGGRLNSGNNFKGIIDDVRLYNRALTQQEILQIMQGAPAGPASEPIPAAGKKDVSRDVILSWTPGEFADKHNVYFGTNFNNVNNADTDSPLLVGPGLDTNTFDPGRLEFDQIYYWRIDEVNAPPDLTVFKGDVWSFTVEPFAIPIDGVAVTASSYAPDQDPENTVNGSGLVDQMHSTGLSDMWLTSESDTGPAWILFDFEKACKLHEMQVWNYNREGLNTIYGLRDVIIEHSIDGTNWTQLSDVPEFPKAPGTNDYTPSIVNLSNVITRYVKITANSNWSGGLFNQYGLSEVRFVAIPVSARSPSPNDGATDVAINTTLGWIAGREAAKHYVYISADQQAVIDGTALVDTVSHASYSPSPLDLDSTYYWRVDEVNNVEIPEIWEGYIWSFTTQEFLVVEDFESYNDIEAGQEGSNLVFLTWTDGYDNPATNGSTAGYPDPDFGAGGHFVETDNVHGGDQCLPLLYDNTIASYSEVTVSTDDLAVGRDWSVGAPEILSLWYYGNPNNAATEQMYVRLNNFKIVQNVDLTHAFWQELPIDLADFGVNLGNVTTLSIGFERIGATGGSGTVFIDDIRLYPPLPEPTDEWTYTYDGDTAILGETDNYDSLDGTWDHDSDSDSWDGTGPGQGNPGGASVLTEGEVTFLRIQDTGDPRDYGASDPSNRKIFFSHQIESGLAGTKLEFRIRIASTPPLDDVNPDGGSGTYPWPEGGMGFQIRDSGKGMIGIGEEGLGMISFSLAKAGEPGLEQMTTDVLVMNNLVGKEPSGDVDTEDTSGSIVVRNWVAVDDATQWNTVEVEIFAGGTGTHIVNVSINGGPAEMFEVTVSNDNDAEGNYIGIGSFNTDVITAFDVDYFSYK